MLFAALACTPRAATGPSAAPPVATAPAVHVGIPGVRVAAARGSADEPLPAGIYYRHHSYQPCNYLDGVSETDGICTTPTHLLVAVFHADAAAAEVMARRADMLDLTPGYPFVAHRDELGVVGDAHGIAVVVGQFASREGAQGWQAVLDGQLPTQIVSLASSDEAFADLPQGQPTRVAARIVSVSEVSAFASVAPAESGVSLPPNHDEEKGHSADEPLTPQVCTFARGAVVVADYEQLQLGFYEWMPVRCPNGREAWVHWLDTTLGVSVRRVGDAYQVIRLLGAECDSPWFETWPFSSVEPTPPKIAQAPRGGGCGG